VPIVACLMGPTASGKTEIAISLAKRLPVEIISVDSALVYRGMDIGTAKPDAETLARVPHRLIDIREPEEPYSAGDFVRDARAAIRDAHAREKIPLLVGGTMMYFRALIEGIAELPAAEPGLRAEIDAEAAEAGWPALHARLGALDPEAAARLNPNDSQRIQRALEVYLATGRTLTEWLRESAGAVHPADRFVKLAVHPADRSRLHERIALRLDAMLDAGFVDEVRMLMARPSLEAAMPSMRAVGYRQFWRHLAGEWTFEEARYRALVATRQLAKRQVTWLRAEGDLQCFDPLESGTSARISETLVRLAGKNG
jgi:tRNA dimethylallyltransferase